jgi:tetratricopeptide (TPR) repeat protein
LIGWRKTGRNQRRERGTPAFLLSGLGIKQFAEHMNTRLFLLVAALELVLISSATMLTAHESHHDAQQKLGAVSFPISCSAESQQPFERGVALLDSFWYEEADKQFKQVADADPHCAMAYWGEAMTLYHELWNPPNEPALKQGWDLVQKAQAANAKTQRERDYIDALAAFYRDSGKLDHEQRAAAYAQDMEKLYSKYPDDHEAAVFYALALLASGPDHDTTLEHPKKAIAILTKIFEQEPDHPGVAHYLIHAADNPHLAQVGLPAARRYAEIAPASPHAVHMPSHIFARLGLWQDDIHSNLRALEAVRRHPDLHMGADRIHSMDFLEYAYLQIGDNSRAMEMVKGLATIDSNDIDQSLGDYLSYGRAHFPAVYAIETRQWKDAIALEPPAGAKPHIRSITYWARALGAGHLRDAATARAAVAQYQAMVEQTRQGKEAYIAKYMDTDGDEARAWLAFAEGKNEEALALLRPLADRQDAEGKGEVELPAREMLADMLLEMNHPKDALAEYERSLKTDPNRFNGLYGAAQAAELANQLPRAAEYYAQLLKNCGTTSERTEVARARTVLARR